MHRFHLLRNAAFQRHIWLSYYTKLLHTTQPERLQQTVARWEWALLLFLLLCFTTYILIYTFWLAMIHIYTLRYLAISCQGLFHIFNSSEGGRGGAIIVSLPLRCVAFGKKRDECVLRLINRGTAGELICGFWWPWRRAVPTVPTANVEQPNAWSNRRYLCSC